jgi:putative sterol carrier protein
MQERDKDMTQASPTVEYSKIKQLVEDTEPEELSEAFAAAYGGYDTGLQQVFDLYQQTFDAELAEGESGRFLFVLDTPEGGKPYLLTVNDGVLQIDAGPADDITCTIKLDLADFLRMSCGQTNGAMLAMTGKLETEGDVMAAMNLGEWFVIPESAD